MMCADQLDDELHSRLVALSELGNALADAGDMEGALARFREALALLPVPPSRWEAATWLLTAIGDVCFQLGRHAEAVAALKQAMQSPGAIGNPFIHLRLGQAHFDLKQFDRAKDELARAYMGGGDEVFEAEDRKYRDYIREILRPREDI